MTSIAAAKVLQFWFGRIPAPSRPSPALNRRWFHSDAAFDEVIRQQFGSLVEQGLAGGLGDWTESVRGTLALVILLDQFPRNLYRNSARAFAGDGRAVAIASDVLAHGRDSLLTPLERQFLYLPFEHAEDRGLQDVSVERFQALVRETAGDAADHYRSALDFALRHKRVIDQFGRFPHRNGLLGRSTSAAERIFLEAHPSGF